jgi:integrase/recombinase XerC
MGTVNTDTALERYRREQLVNLAASSVGLRMQHLNDLRKVYPDLLKVTYDDLINYLTDERRKPLKPESRKSIRASLRSFYSWAYVRKLIKVDPAYPIKTIKVPHSEARQATNQQVVAGLEGASDRDRAVILLARLGCLRRAEIANLPVAARRGRVLVVHGKGDKDRNVPLPPDLLDALTVLEDGREFYFPNKQGQPIDVSTVWRIVHDKVGINTHALRHAGATASFRSTNNIRAVQTLLGHSNVATTQRYVHVDEDELLAAAMGTAIS